MCNEPAQADARIDTIGVHTETTNSINKISKIGDFFEICLEGKKAIIKTTNGALYIEQLLAHPNKEIHVNELERFSGKKCVELTDKNISDGEMAENNMHVNSCPIKMADHDTIKAVESRLADVKEKLNDLASIEASLCEETEEKVIKLENEKKKIEQYLKEVKRERGQSRDFDDETEKARKRVWRAIQDVLDRLKKDGHELIHDHLSQCIVKREFCLYKKPEELANWSL